MLSEDTGTQGRGNFELELGYDWSQSRTDHGFLFQPQLSYGVLPSFDLIVQPSWLDIESGNGTRARGMGDTNFDAKWRFYGAAPWSLGVRAGVEAPTAQHDLGEPAGRFSPHGILVATFDAAPVSIDLNLGFARSPAESGQRANLYHLSAAMNYAQSERLFYVIDAAMDTNPDPGQASHQGVALLGAIYTVHPGLDVDFGYRNRVGPAGPLRQWLVGITLRGAP